MIEHINKEMVQKIKELLSNYEEEYSEGAWEQFLAHKHNKKRRQFIWYFRGAAASLITFLILGPSIWRDLQGIEYKQNEITKEKYTPTPIDIYEKQNNLFDIKETKAIETTTPFGKQKYLLNIEDNLSDKIEINTITKTLHPLSSSIHLIDSISLKNTIAKQIPFDKEKEHGKMSLEKDQPNNFINSRDYIIKSIASKTEPIPKIDTPFNHLDSLILTEAKHESLSFNDEEIFENYINNKKLVESNNKIQIGLVLSPSFGSSSNYEQSIASSTLSAGLDVNIPIDNSKFSLNTGLIVNSIKITNEKTLNGEYSSISQSSEHAKINIYNIDIPLNFLYNILNNKIYFQTGVSSYLTFRENTDLSSTIVRAKEVIQFQNGVSESITITETTTTNENSFNNDVRLLPLAAINLSVGYRASLSKNLHYEIQPFYKLPLRDLTSSTPTAGLAFKLLFSQ